MPSKHSDAPYKHTGSALVGARDAALRDVSDTAISQLTGLLRLTSDVNPNNPPQWWIDEQESLICRLDDRLRAPTNVVSRVAIRLGKRNVKYFPQTAVLCDTHEGLDPRVIRNLFLLVFNECSARTQKYRDACRNPNGKNLMLPPAAEQWLNGMDAMLMLLLGDNSSFARLCCYQPNFPNIFPSVKCEACMLSMVGGNLDMLANLRAGLRARQKVSERPSRRLKAPRLIAILSEWYSQEDSIGDIVRKKSDNLQPDLEEARRIILTEKQRIREKRKQSRKKKHSHHRHHSSKRQHEKPRSISPRPSTSVSRQAYRDTDRASVRPQTSIPAQHFSYTRKCSTTTQETRWPTFGNDPNDDDFVPDPNFIPSPLSERGEKERARFPGQGPPSPPISVDTPRQKYAFMDDEYDGQKYAFMDEDDDDDDEDEEDGDEAAAASKWFKRRTEGWADVDKTELAQAMPAFSTFQAESAVPSPLHPTPVQSERGSIHNGNRTDSWRSATVHTYVPPPYPRPGSTDAPPSYPRSAAPPSYPRPASSYYGADPNTLPERESRVPFELFRQRFCREEALARMEGRPFTGVPDF